MTPESKRTLSAAAPDREPSLLRRNWPGYEDRTRTHVVNVAGVKIGGDERVVIAGPCAVESFEQTLATARAVQAAGCLLMRGGAYKPRTDPHAFQGLGPEGLEILAEVRRQTGLGIVTEVLDPRLVEQVAAVADMLQIGSRSSQNFPLLAEVGRSSKPVLLKRGWSATLKEWIGAAEYIAREGNRDIVLCERGVRTTFAWDHERTVLDLEVFEPAREATPLPIIADPSHATEDWTQVPGLSRAATESGAHGLLIEVLEPGSNRTGIRCDAHRGIPAELLPEIMASTRAAKSKPAERNTRRSPKAPRSSGTGVEAKGGISQ